MTAQPLKWLGAAFGASVLLNLLAILYLVGEPVSLREAMSVTLPGQVAQLLEPQFDDSWRTMAWAEKRHQDDPQGDLYSVFFDDGIKFQYPPSSLLFWDLFPGTFEGPESPNPGSDLKRWLRITSLAAVLLTIVFSVLILEAGLAALHRVRDSGWKSLTGVIVFACVLALCFYPLSKGYRLGQVQVFIGCLAAAALYAYLKGWRSLAGVCFGLCCLVKPQYGVILLWALIRRDWRFSFALGVTAALGLGAALIEYGFHNHLRYVDVLQVLSRHGEAYWPNQSFNGFLNRFLGNGEAQRFRLDSFAPYHPGVYYATLVTSAIILAIALWHRPGSGNAQPPGVVDLSIALMGATIASPIAWEHHYGAFLPVFAVALPIIMAQRPAGRWSGGLLLLSYLMMANVVLRPDLIFWERWRGALGSHLFFGALLLFGLCVAVRNKASRATSALPGQVLPAVPLEAQRISLASKSTT